MEGSFGFVCFVCSFAHFRVLLIVLVLLHSLRTCMILRYAYLLVACLIALLSPENCEDACFCSSGVHLRSRGFGI